MAGATITLTPGGQTSTSNSAGAYSFTGLTVGNYTVTITPPSGFTLPSTEQAAKSATVTAGQTTTVSWTLQPVTGTTVNISVGDNFFSPAVDTVVVGTTVKWTNNGNVAHTTTSDASTPVWDGNLSTGGSFQFTFTQAGSFPYHCEIHSCKASQGCSSMNGTIVVQ
ncbi:MAG: carboxypeptidase regulatory-like domain-containing protein [Gemmatimonadetes bacterium]|nr:carboxypeptidase regulatory-like domain-containing protein [Gemmatimonadota bacterium]